MLPLLIKRLLFIGMLAILCLPLLQHLKPFVQEEALHGAVKTTPMPSLTDSSWFSGEFQTQFGEVFNEKLGFRPSLVRLDNQIAWTLFKENRGNNVVVGKDGYLYELPYIKGYYGLDYSSEEEVKEKFRKLSVIRDTLANYQIPLFMVVAAGKASYYPEYIPDQYKPDSVGRTLYQEFLTQLNDFQIPYIDFNDLFLRMKDTTTHPLFPRTGIHWSSYADVFVADSIAHYVEYVSGKKLPEIVVDGLVELDKPMHRDEDMEEIMNLMEDLPDNKMSYPYFHVELDSNQIQPKVLAISDSYFWGIYNAGFSQSVFGNGGFWFYYWDKYPKDIYNGELNLKEELLSKDAIFLMATEANFRDFGWSGIDEMYRVVSSK